MAADRVLGEHQHLGDLLVAVPLRDERQDLELARREPEGGLTTPRACWGRTELAQQRAGATGREPGADREERGLGAARLPEREVVTAELDQNPGELEPHLGGLERRPRALEEIERVLEVLAAHLVVAVGVGEHSARERGRRASDRC